MPPKGYKKKAPKNKKKPKTNMKALVKQEVKKQTAKDIEDKNVVTQDQTFLMFQGGATTLIGPQVETLTPTIVQGVGENGRIGNTLTIKSCILRGYLSVAGSVLNSQVPAGIGQWNVRLFIGKLKTSNSQPNTTDLNILLRTGAFTEPFNSTNGLSLVRSVNKELFTIYYDKIHKIGFQNGNNASVSTGLHNNDYKLSKLLTINLTKKIIKKLVFTEGLNTPTNMGIYMWGGLCDSLCSGFTSAAGFVNFIYDLEYIYEDA